MSLINNTLQLFQEGGWVIIPLALLSFVLCYALFYRFLTLKCVAKINSLNLSSNNDDKGLIAWALIEAKKIKSDKNLYWAEVLQEKWEPVKNEASRYSSLIKAIIFIAPLLGLLGTVGGMIETFDSLGDSALFSSSGGIAGGISQALLTTQMGLIVAIPGLFVGRYLDGLEKKLTSILSQLQDQLGAEIKG